MGRTVSICEICPTTPGAGWQRPHVTHCSTCHATWRLATKITHCVTCHETFSTPANCDRHQTGTKADPGWRCRPPADVGLIRNDRDIWQAPGREVP